MTFPFASFCPSNSMPDPFSFTDAVNVVKNTVTTSNTITPTGYDSIAEVSATNGAQVSISGGAWTSLITYMSPGDTIAVRMTSANAWSTQTSTDVTIGGRTSTWHVTTATASTGSWDSGWTTGTWSVSTPQFFNWFRVQLWAPAGGGGGGGGGEQGSSYGSPGSPGGAGGYAQFNAGPKANGGGAGGGGRGATGGAFPANGATGTAGAAGTATGGDTNTTGGGATGGNGGAGGTMGNGIFGGTGGKGGNGGYLIKTYNWGDIAPSTLFSLVVQNRGGGGSGAPPTIGSSGAGSPGAAGGFGRGYVDWA